MIGQIFFTTIAFVFFIYVLLAKLVKKNDTTYLIILGLQATGIFLNLIKISFNIFKGIAITSFIFTLCVIIPILVVILELKKINISEILRISMAQCNFWLHKHKKAKKILTDLVEKYNDSYMGHKMLAKIYEKEGGMRKAIDEYVYVLDIKKNDHKAYYRISVLLNELGRKEEATQMLRTLLKNRPYIYEASEMLGNIFLEKREYKNAIETYTNSLKYYPENYEIYYNLGVCYSMINDFAIAKKCFQKTVEINDDMYLAYYRLGQIALLYREFDIAEINFSKSVYKEKEAKAYIELAKIHIMKNQKEKAILAVNNALKVESACYSIIEQEPVFFSIKNSIAKPEKENKIEYLETEKEKQIDEYLKDTYNLTKILNSKKEVKPVITEMQET